MMKMIDYIENSEEGGGVNTSRQAMLMGVDQR